MSTSSQPCNSTALAPRTFVPVHDLPSQSFRSNGGCCPTVLRRFGHFLALTVPSAVGFAPCSFYAAPWRILAFTTRSHTTSQNSNYAILTNFWNFSFAKYRTLRKNPQTQYSCGFADIYFQNSRFWKCLLTFWTTCYILYLSQILSVFAKYDTLRNFLSIGRKKHGTLPAYRVFVYSPAAYPPPTSSPRSQVYTQHTTSPSCSV